MSEKSRGFRSGELARAVGISTDTLRHYERLGILSNVPRTPSGYRVYPPDSADRIHAVRRAVRLGFTLAELAEILRIRDSDMAPCRRVLEMFESKLRTLRSRIADLQETEKYMESIAGEWRSKIAGTQPGKKAFLLHSLGPVSNPGISTGERLIKRRKQ